MIERTSIGINVALPVSHAAELATGVVALAGRLEWNPPLKHRGVLQNPRPSTHIRPGVVGAKKLADDMRRLLADPSVYQYSLSSSQAGGYPQSKLTLRANPEGRARLWLNAATAFVDAGSAASWFAAFGELAAACHVSGGLAVIDDYLNTKQDASLTTFSTHEPNTHKDQNEVGRMQLECERLGRDFVFFPRWGTWISHAHAAAVGGIAAIRARVEPALVEDVGTAWYVQVTSLEEARSPEAAEKIVKFTKLVEPLLPPA